MRRKKSAKGNTICIICKVNEIEPKRHSYCNGCRRGLERKYWHKSSKEKRISKWLKNKYNLSYEDYVNMYESQNKKCAICETDIITLSSDNSNKTACVDHCHTTNKIRGLLCNHCNRALGLVKENINTLKIMINYLERHSIE